MTDSAKAEAASPEKGGQTANQLLFGFQGRADRLQFWLVTIAGAAIFALFWSLVNLKAPLAPGEPPPPPPSMFVAALESIPTLIGIGLLWPLAAIGVKRCHDRGRSGWWMLLALVPVVGQLWWLIDLGILRGKAEDNRFGPAPSAGEAGTRDLQSTTVMFFLGFSAGLPNLLVFGTLSIWLRDVGVDLTTITLFSLATMFTALKFLWAPIVDRTQVPVLTRLLGHRRSWMLVSQIVLILALWLISGSDPKANLGLVAVFACLASFASANQDIVIDAWRIEVAEDSKQGAMAAAYQWGYRIALVIAGVIPLLLAELYSWNLSYAVMAALVLVGVLATLAAPREAEHKVRPVETGGLAKQPVREAFEWIARALLLIGGALIVGVALAGSPDFLANLMGKVGFGPAGETLKAAWKGDAKVYLLIGSIVLGFALLILAAVPLPGRQTRPGVILYSTLLHPVVHFFGRYGNIAAAILALICVYRVADFLLNVNGAFYLDLGFTKREIAEAQKLFGALMSVLGVAIGGWCVLKLGLMRTLILGAFTGTLSNLAFAWLAVAGHSMPALVLSIAADNIGGGIAGTALIAYMSSLTSAGFTATQYALFSSLYALIGKILASQSGRIVEAAAKDADAGGGFASLKNLMLGLPPESYADALSKSSVTPAALGVGYLVFYVYTTLVGVFGMVLVFYVAARQPKPKEEVA